MRCACCNKYMRKAAMTVRKPWITLGGMSGIDVLNYGPKCAQRLGLIQVVQRKAKTQPMAIKRKGAISNRTLEVQDGQIQLFEMEMA